MACPWSQQYKMTELGPGSKSGCDRRIHPCLLLRARVSLDRLCADGSLSKSVHLKKLGQITSYVPHREKGRKEVSFSFEKLRVEDLEGQGTINRGSEFDICYFCLHHPILGMAPRLCVGDLPYIISLCGSGCLTPRA